MKRGTPEHPKVADLCERLKLKPYEAVGILEMLWHFAAKFTPRGDLGKYPDSAITKALGWSRDPGALMAALIESRWLDKSNEHRYIIHDWPKHCDDSVHMRIARSLEYFADGSTPSTSRLPKSERERIESEYKRMLCARQAQQSSMPCALPLPVPLPEPKPVPLLPVSKVAEMPKPTPGEEFPKSAEAIKRRFPSTNDALIRNIVDRAVQEVIGAGERPELVTDEVLLRALEECTDKKQYNAALYLHTIPTWFRNMATLE